MLIWKGPAGRYAINLKCLAFVQETVPKFQWAINVYYGKASNDLIFDGFDSRFRGIKTVVVWLDYLDVDAIAF